MTEKLLKKEELVLLEKIKEIAPDCVNEDGKLDIRKLAKKMPVGTVFEDEERTDFNFLGKNYARMLASVETETVIVPDTEHNSKPENANSQNIYISGDNLDALKHLLKSYEGKVKCIYIDPPYNTGSDGFVYNDTFNYTSTELAEKLGVSEEKAKKILNMTTRGSSSDSAWLTFMLSRLLLAKDMLTEDGVIFISIDDNEQANLKLLCDDVFGSENFLTCVSRSTGTPTGGGFDGLVNELDYILVYAKDITFAVINGLTMSKRDEKIYNEVDEYGNRYLTRTLRRTGGEDRREDRPTMYYPLTAPNGTEVYPIGPTGYESRWMCSKASAEKLEANNLLTWKIVNINGKDTWMPFQKYYLNGRLKKPGNIWKDFFMNEDENIFLWDDIDGNKKATKDIKNIFDGKKVFETAKPKQLIERIINISSCNNDLILDFFSGSATTAHAVMQLNADDNGKRHFIMVQLQEKCKMESEAAKVGYKTIDQIGIERIKRAAQKIRKKHPDTTADLGFKHFTLKAMPKDRLENLEKFDPNAAVLNDNNLNAFGTETLLTTWMEHDGYGLTSSAEQIDFDGYKGYRIGTHLYLFHSGLTNSAVKAIVEKYNSCPDFGKIQNIVLFEYGFSYGEVEALKRNLISVGSKLGIAFNFEKRF